MEMVVKRLRLRGPRSPDNEALRFAGARHVLVRIVRRLERMWRNHVLGVLTTTVP